MWPVSSIGHTVDLPFPVQAKRDQRMAKPLSEVVREVSKKDIEPWVKAIVFELSCNDTEGEEVEVKLHFYTLDTSLFQKGPLCGKLVGSGAFSDHINIRTNFNN